MSLTFVAKIHCDHHDGVSVGMDQCKARINVKVTMSMNYHGLQTFELELPRGWKENRGGPDVGGVWYYCPSHAKEH